MHPNRTVVDGDQTVTLVHVGWISSTNRLYSITEQPELSEPGGFSALWVVGEESVTDQHTTGTHQQNIKAWSIGGGSYYPHYYNACAFREAGYCCCGKSEGSITHHMNEESEYVGP